MDVSKQISQLLKDKKSIPLILVVLFGLLSIVDILTTTPVQPNVKGANTVAVRVIDGDTVEVQVDGDKQTVRLIGIDTPETKAPQKPVECFGLEATAKLKELIERREIYLESDPTQQDRDRYDRLLRYIFLPNGTNINLEMIRQGYAYEYTYDVPYKYQTEFENAQFDARNRNLGLWNESTCNGER